MGLVYLRSQNNRHLEEVLNYCLSINEDAMIEHDRCVFDVNGPQRIQLKLTLETFQADLQDLLICVEGFKQDDIMNCAMDLAQLYAIGRYIHISELLLDSALNNNDVLLKKLNVFFQDFNSELIETARMYLWADGNALLAAQSLYLHRNTFNYRMNKFIQKSNLRLSEQAQAYFFQLWLNLQ